MYLLQARRRPDSRHIILYIKLHHHLQVRRQAGKEFLFHRHNLRDQSRESLCPRLVLLLGFPLLKLSGKLTNLQLIFRRKLLMVVHKAHLYHQMTLLLGSQSILIPPQDSQSTARHTSKSFNHC